MAQYIGDAPPPPAAPAPGTVESPPEVLSRNLRLIAQNPRNSNALVAAGRAALKLGDFQAAAGFFGRAEELNPRDPAPKIGMGAASVQMGDSAAALQFFLRAQQLGASAAAMGADRGLAHDLNGNQATAQADYRAALAGPDRDEARRRLALSLGISGDRTNAFAMLQPLLMRRDPAAARVRAFVLALLGDRAGARTAIEAAMPGSAARIDPFFAMLPRLSAEQKAAAVHLGVFPTPGERQMAAVAPPVAPPTAAPIRRAVTPAPATRAPAVTQPERPRTVRATSTSIFDRMPARNNPSPEPARPAPTASVNRGAPIVSPLTREVASAAPSIASPVDVPESSGPSAAENIALPPVVSEPTEREAFVLPSETAPPVVAQPAASFSLPSSTLASIEASDTAPVTPSDRLSGIDKLLAEVSEAAPPPAPQPKVETAEVSDKAARAKEAADAKKATAARKAADAKKAEARKAAEAEKEREALGVAGTNWVQLAGGSNADRMGAEYKKLAAKSSALRKRAGHVTQGKDYFRLLVGPFDSKSAAQTFVNSLAKDGVDGFSWTRTPAAIKIEKLPPK